MERIVTATFDGAEAAAAAAAALGVVRADNPGMTVSRPASAHSAAVMGLGRPLQTDIPQDAHLVQVRCSPDGEADAVKELAALGARKISVSGEGEE